MFVVDFPVLIISLLAVTCILKSLDLTLSASASNAV